MATVSGQSFFSVAGSAHIMAELQPSSSDSDDDYDYVSILAEQIAHAMLEEDEPSEKETVERDTTWSSQGALWSGRPKLDIETKKKTRDKYFNVRAEPLYMNEVGFQAQPHAVEELSFFEESRRKGSPPLQAGWKNLHLHNHHNFLRKASHCHSYYTQNVEARPCGNNLSRYLQESSMYQGWSSRNHGYNRRQVAVSSNACHVEEQPCEAWKLPLLEARTAPAYAAFRKESIGTGVFFPRVNNLGSQQYRRKTDLGGLASSKLSLHLDKSKRKTGRLCQSFTKEGRSYQQTTAQL